MKKECWSQKKIELDSQENTSLAKENVVGTIMQEDLILSLESMFESWVIDSQRHHFMLLLVEITFKIM